MKTFWERTDEIPPLLARLLARSGPYGCALSDSDIAKASGLSEYRVFLIGQYDSWNGIDFLSMQKFLVACNVDFCNRTQMRRIDKYIQSAPRFKYLRKLPDWLTRYEPMFKRYIHLCKSRLRT